MITRPNLAAKIKPNQTWEEFLARFPWHPRHGALVSPKIDGIRLLMHPEHGPVTRSFKKIPNRRLREYLEANLPAMQGFDGELCFGNPSAPDYTFQATDSAVMSFEGPLEGMQFHVFDDFTHPGEAFVCRQQRYHDRTMIAQGLGELSMVHAVQQIPVMNLQQVFDAEANMLLANYEGAMLRHACMPYKSGRSTLLEGGLVAIKRFEEAEAIIIGFEELMHNDNEAEEDAFGNVKRSTAQAGKVPSGMLGKMIVQGCPHTQFAGKIFRLGAGKGLTHSLRRAMWQEGIDRYHGRMVTYKYQPVGVKDKPRACTFKGFRNDL